MYRFLYRLAHLDLYQEPRTVRYGLALLFVVQALALNSLPPAAASLPFLFFFGAVALSARLCGFGPAVLATVLSSFLARFFFISPYFSLVPTLTGLRQVLLFMLISLIITSAALQTSVARITAIESQNQLLITERRLQFAQVAAKLGSWEWNLKTNDLWWTERNWALHGRPIGPRPPTLEDWTTFVHPEDRERCQQAVQQSLAGTGDYEVEYRTIWPDGSVRWIVARGRVVFDDAKQPERVLGIGMDITDRKQAEEALRRSEKLAAAGRLAATIAHEINNPLAAVTNLLYLLRQCESWDEKARWYVAQAERELARVTHVARQTLGFYRDTTSPRLVNLPKTVEEVVSLYMPRIEARKLKLISDLDPRAQVMGLAGEIRQVISNLVANALDALEEGGTLSIRVHRSRELNALGRPGSRIIIADSGSGIRPEQRQKLFEPFFTTKQDIGTGLGLWVSREMVHKHGGNIRLRSSTAPGRKGTVFSVFLPAKTGVAINDPKDYRAVS